MKSQILVCLSLLTTAAFSAPAEHTKLIYISVDNGGQHGNWGDIDVCPEGSLAVGFSTKVERLPLLDATAMNGVRLHCFDSVSQNETTAESASEQWGSWGFRIRCPENGYLTSFALRVLPDQGTDADDTAVNDIQFKCNTGEILDGRGLDNGEWGNWSAECTTGICGLQTKVQSDQGTLVDDTALNDVQFFCC